MGFNNLSQGPTGNTKTLPAGAPIEVAKHIEAFDIEEIKRKIVDPHTLAKIIAVLSGLISSNGSKIKEDHYGLAEDLAQETILKASKNAASFRGDSNIDTWMYRIAKNEFFTYFRKNSNSVRDMKATDSLDQLLENHDFPHSELSPSEAEIISKIDSQTHMAILKKELDPKEYELLTLRYVENLSYQEISEKLSLPMGTIKSHLNRLKTKIKKIVN